MLRTVLFREPCLARANAAVAAVFTFSMTTTGSCGRPTVSAWILATTTRQNLIIASAPSEPILSIGATGTGTSFIIKTKFPCSFLRTNPRRYVIG